MLSFWRSKMDGFVVNSYFVKVTAEDLFGILFECFVVTGTVGFFLKRVCANYFYLFKK